MKDLEKLTKRELKAWADSTPREELISAVMRVGRSYQLGYLISSGKYEHNLNLNTSKLIREAMRITKYRPKR